MRTASIFALALFYLSSVNKGQSMEPEQTTSLSQLELTIDALHSGRPVPNHPKFIYLFPDGWSVDMSSKECFAFISFWSGELPFPAEITEKMRLRALDNDMIAQNNLGYMYKLGLGVEKDDDKAIYWFKKAGEQGFAPSQFYLWDMQKHGFGGDEDYNQAVYWLKKAAENGHAKAQRLLSRLYNKAHGVEKDDDKALYWLEKAAENGDYYAQRDIFKLCHQAFKNNKDPLYFCSFYLRGIKRENLELLGKFKIFFNINYNAPILSDIPGEGEAILADLQHELDSFKEFYCYCIGLSGGRYKDSFGENLDFGNRCNTVFETLLLYETVLKQISEPGYLITCLRPSKSEVISITFYFRRSTTKVISFVDAIPVKKLFGGALLKQVDNFLASITRIGEKLPASGHDKAAVKSALESLTDASDQKLALEFLSLYEVKNEDVELQQEYARVKKFLDSLKVDLKRQRKKVKLINNLLLDLLEETTPYRNYLFKQNYPMLFEKSQTGILSF